MLTKDNFAKFCYDVLESKGLTTEQHKKRLADELKEIDAQNEHEYFINLHIKKVRYPQNQNNLLVPYLLGIVSEIDISKPPAYVYGEFPDIDIDYIPQVRDYLKNVWAPQKYGADRVCNIGSYNTFGIKSAMQDMARVYNKPRGEVIEITKELEAKDDEGKLLTWKKAMEIYPALRDYCAANDQVATAAESFCIVIKAWASMPGV